MLKRISDLSDDARALLAEQERDWAMLRENRAELANVRVRAFDFGVFQVKVQCNPARLASSLAKVDEKSIRQRQCFLCDSARPAEQKSLDCGDGFVLLCNPFPILPEHFTIILEQHRPQRIQPWFAKMLELAQGMGKRHTVFYNGPQCGASAPDHMHFQAGSKGFIPVEIEYERMKRPVSIHERLSVFLSEDYLRWFIGIESSDAQHLTVAFARLHETLKQIAPNAAEPMMNVLCSFEAGSWRVIIFPRVKHRPAFYFAADHTRMLLSPGTVDVGGIVVAVVEDDFNRISREHLVQMYHEITVSPEVAQQLAESVSLVPQVKSPVA